MGIAAPALPVHPSPVIHFQIPRLWPDLLDVIAFLEGLTLGASAIWVSVLSQQEVAISLA
jgi:hypothetical protein